MVTTEEEHVFRQYSSVLMVTTEEEHVFPQY